MELENLDYRIRLAMFAIILVGLGILGVHAKPGVLLLWSTANYAALVPLVIGFAVMALDAARHFGDALTEMKSK